MLEAAIQAVDHADAREARRRADIRRKLLPKLTNNMVHVDEYIHCIPAGD